MTMDSESHGCSGNENFALGMRDSPSLVRGPQAVAGKSPEAARPDLWQFLSCRPKRVAWNEARFSRELPSIVVDFQSGVTRTFRRQLDVQFDPEAVLRMCAFRKLESCFGY